MQSTNTQRRVKKTRKAAHVDPKAKKGTLARRMRSKVNTKQRRGINLTAVAKVEKRAEGPKAERRLTSIKVRTEEVAQEAETETLKIKKRSQRVIIVKIEIRVMGQIKSIRRTPKAEMARELGQSLAARKEQEMNTDLVAETGTEVDLQHQKKERRNETKAGRRAEIAAGVENGDTTATGGAGGEAHPETRNAEQEVQTETSPETRTEAGDPGVGVRETAAKIGRLTEGTERLQTKEGDIAAVPIAIETGRGRATEAQTLNGAEGKVLLGLEKGGAPSNQDLIVRKARTETGARGTAPARIPAQAQTATNVLKFRVSSPHFVPTVYEVCNTSSPFNVGLHHIHQSVQTSNTEVNIEHFVKFM